MSANTHLTAGAVRTMISMIGKPPNHVPPMIVQVINMKSVASANGDRFRAVLSDGTHYVTGMLASQVMKNTGVQQDCIIRVDDYMCNEVSNRHVIILLGITVLEQATGRIGTPIDIEKAGASSTASAPISAPQPLYNSTNNAPNTNPSLVDAYKSSDRPMSAGSSGTNPYGRLVSPQQQNQPIVRSNNISSGITPIGALNMYNNRWTIQARLTVKSDIKTWSNAKGEGSLFSVELLDSTMDTDLTIAKTSMFLLASKFSTSEILTKSYMTFSMFPSSLAMCISEF